VLVALRLGGSPPPSVAPPPPNLPGQLHWITVLVDGPPRGNVAADASFVRDLTARMEELSRTSQSLAFGGPEDRSTDGRRARVLFAEDIDDQRIALVALQRPSVPDSIRRYALTDLLWLTGPRSATVETLVGAVAHAGPVSGTEYRLQPVAPFAAMEFGDASDPLWIAIAPPPCQVATAPAADLAAWRDGPAGSYLLRRPRRDGPEYWRVTCDGVVREERAAPRPAVSQDDLDGVLATAVGDPDRAQVEIQLSVLTSAYGATLVTLPRVVFSGALAYSPIAFDAADIYYYYRQSDLSRPPSAPIEATITVATAPRAGGGFISSTWMILQEGPDVLYALDSPTFFTEVDPGAPDALVAVRIDRWQRQVMVLAPESAATVQLLSRDGLVLDRSAAGDQPIMLGPGSWGPMDDLRVKALDAAGSVIATTELAATDIPRDHTTAWE
jgi:hypothetical protein